MITVVVPAEAMRERLRPKLGDFVRLSLWHPDDAVPPPPADLLVYPYMAPYSHLRALAGAGIAVVQGQTLGYDGVAPHLPPGVVYCNAVDVHEASTGELALTLILAALRGIPDAVRDGARGEWAHRRRPGLAGRAVLLIGAGGVGREVLRRLEPFDVDLTVAARTARPGIHGLTEIPRLLARAEIVILAVPLSAETRRFVDAAFLAAMREGALLVNVSRGAVVDTEALVAAVRHGRVRAALDVTDPEPLPSDHPLWSLPDVLITPHLGGDTDAMDARIDRLVVEQVRRLRSGEPPANVVHGTPTRAAQAEAAPTDGTPTR